MRFISLVLSLCLHAAIFLAIIFWPAPPPLKLDAPPIMISLVEGAPGGNRTPSPILGYTGSPNDGPLAPAPPAPQSEVAAPERQPAPQAAAEPQEKPLEKPVPIPEKLPEPVKEPQQPAPPPVEEKTIPVKKPEPEPKKPEPPKPEPKKPEPKKPEPKKPEPKKEEKTPQSAKPAPKPAPKPDPVAAALAQARKATSRANSAIKGNAVEQALAEARKSASGTGGGGGGEGEGPGGGGLGDVYIGQVMLAVRPNWGFATSARLNLACVVKVNLDMAGKVLNAAITRSSGNAQFDASAVNAVVRTGAAGDFPPPPNPQYTDLDLVFTLDEMRKR